MAHSRQSKGYGAVPNTFGWLIDQFKASPKFQHSLADATKSKYDFLLMVAREPDSLGAIPMKDVKAKHVQEFLDVFAKHPAQQTCAKVVMGSVQKWAIAKGHIDIPFMIGTEVNKCKGHRQPWLEHQIQTAIKYARPDLARAVTLGAYLGQRGSDLVRMRFSHIRSERGYRGIFLVTKKTDKPLFVPFLPELDEAISRWEHERRQQSHVGPDFLFVQPDGKPYTRPHLSEHWVRHRATNPHLVEHECLQLSMHGLRASAVIRFRQAGVSRPLIQDAVGLSARMVDLYCARSDQTDNAIAAMEQLLGGKKTAEIIPLRKEEKE